MDETTGRETWEVPVFQEQQSQRSQRMKQRSQREREDRTRGGKVWGSRGEREPQGEQQRPLHGMEETRSSDLLIRILLVTGAEGRDSLCYKWELRDWRKRGQKGHSPGREERKEEGQARERQDGNCRQGFSYHCKL